jgi:hypothetical protein
VPVPVIFHANGVAHAGVIANDKTTAFTETAEATQRSPNAFALYENSLCEISVSSAPSVVN